MIEVFVLPAVAAIYVVWDLGSEWIRAQKSASAQAGSLKALSDELVASEERSHAAIEKLELRVALAEQHTQTVKNRLESASTATAQRRRWDTGRPVKIG